MLMDQIKNILFTIVKVGGFVLVAYIIIRLILAIRFYIKRCDNVSCYVGGLGSGKTFFSVIEFRKRYKAQCFKVWLHNLFHKKDKWERPQAYSNIPVRMSAKHFSLSLSATDLLGRTRLVPRSVVFLDECSIFVSQWDVKGSDVDKLDYMITLFRHFTLGGYLILNTQSTQKVNHKIRYNLDSAVHLRGFHRIPIINICWTHARTVYTGDDITNTSLDAETEEKTIFAILPPKKRKYYDTFAYSALYPAKEDGEHAEFTDLKAPNLVSISHRFL